MSSVGTETVQVSKLSSKGQITVPKPIREKLGIRAGDRIVYVIKPSGAVFIRKIALTDEAYLNSVGETMNEWNSPEDEKAYFVDAYKVLAKPGALAATNLASLTVTNKPRRRLNEAELVRMLREGEVPDEDMARPAAAEPARPVVTDPALARAIDLLKALAVVRHTRS